MGVVGDIRDAMFGLTCRHCHQRIWLGGHDGVYLDSTGGDVCCADKFMENNENGVHQL